jgi:hypothetical protein
VSQKVVILPTEQMEENYAYGLNIRIRDVLLPTYAAMMAAGDPGIKAVADTVRGVITISVTDTDKYSGRLGLEIALAKARTNLADFGADSSYTLASIGEIEQNTGESWSIRWIAVAVIVGAVVAAGAALTAQRRSARRSRHHRAHGRNEHTVGLSA